jgi:hypothetical protein
MKQGALRKGGQIKAARRDVLSQRARPNVKARGPQLVQKFLMYQVHLTEVHLFTIFACAVTMLNGAACMRIPLYPTACDKSKKARCSC